MVNSTKFLGLTLDNTLSCRPHIDTVAPKLSLAGFALRIVKPLLSPESLRMVYFSYFHSIMTYGIIFWGNSCHSNVTFRLQKRVIRIITGIRNRVLAENISGHSKYYHCSHSMYCRFYFLWLTTKTTLGGTLKYITSTQGINRPFTNPFLTYRYTRKGHIILESGCSIACLHK